MTVKAILDSKGRDVVTISPDRSLAEAAKLLADRGIGAVVVTQDDGRIAGILSERDIVRAVGQEGAAALYQLVSAVMTPKVHRCKEHHTVNEVMQIMTERRFRHLPVEHEGRIAGIISIGDVVKKRIQEVEREAEDIRTYIATA
ncbi:CBS domain-containing protein [Nitratireductor sp. ZSWI3]|uniref:CBS domain-containing protein n=1 Tax=Nitratireductor sp. ZSWI3 TaxID=2966359 RepID=UPI0021503C0B|nr:CBS domain-containing protein [Nitratireductor sp. ZSWI3]MCR4266472.1 CBS domain-containing protein [Nitratireductor sp. ZSWI3]